MLVYVCLKSKSNMYLIDFTLLALLQMPYGKFTVNLKNMAQLNASGASRPVFRGEVFI